MTEHFHQSKRVTKERLKTLMQRKDHPTIFRFTLLYLLFLGASVWVILSWDSSSWWNFILAQLSFGIIGCSIFAVEHETVHGTAFKTKQFNQIAASLAGLAHFYPSSIFRELHFTHHRHTHIPGLDPEISLGNQPGPSILQNPPIYLAWLTGFPLLSFKVMMTFFGAIGMPESVRKKLYPFITPKRRGKIAVESIIVMAVYSIILGLALFVHKGFWGLFIGQIVAHCLLSTYLVMEHNGLPHEGDILDKTRSIPAPKWLKSLMWNMPYHAEHHAYPAVPFHQLPSLHQEMKTELKHQSEGYAAFHSKTIKNFFGRSSPTSIIILGILTILFACHQPVPTTQTDFTPTIELGSKGLHGYIAYDAPKSPEGYGAGVSFYTAAWPLINQPIANFQIGLPGTWIVPDNLDNTTIPLCPKGTLARDNWDERAPTYKDVFQTLEGGLGYWAGNKYRYSGPKFSMNATAQCYDYEIASPGWSFFYDDQPLPTARLGIAQLSNRILIPPDGLTFEGTPEGEFMGYSYMALPLTDAYETDTPTGNQSWTCFINTENFKGPIAYYLPETWSKISANYPIINGRGLDARAGIIAGGAMEINTVPHFESKDSKGQLYTKIPALQFPVDETGKALLVQDLIFYNKAALYDEVWNWRKTAKAFNGTFKNEGSFRPDLSTRAPKYRQKGKEINGIETIFNTKVYDAKTFGLQWKSDTKFKKGHFPQYFKEVGENMIPISEKEVPKETGLLEKNFPLAEQRPPYTSPNNSVWENTAAGPFEVTLNDGSKVTYYWYQFIEQPVFQQFNWSKEKKKALQAFIEKIHRTWPIDRNYIAPPKMGRLVTMDNALIVSPPEGMEVGYVPIVVKQER